MLIKLDKGRKTPNDHGPYRTIYHKQSKPFLVNPRALLVHRVRFVHEIVYDGERRGHLVAIYWCHNIGRGEFVDAPPPGRLMCAMCEATAIAHGKPSSSKLAGRHVHTGKLYVRQLCCTENKN